MSWYEVSAESRFWPKSKVTTNLFQGLFYKCLNFIEAVQYQKVFVKVLLKVRNSKYFEPNYKSALLLFLRPTLRWISEQSLSAFHSSNARLYKKKFQIQNFLSFIFPATLTTKCSLWKMNKDIKKCSFCKEIPFPFNFPHFHSVFWGYRSLPSQKFCCLSFDFSNRQTWDRFLLNGEKLHWICELRALFITDYTEIMGLCYCQ